MTMPNRGLSRRDDVLSKFSHLLQNARTPATAAPVRMPAPETVTTAKPLTRAEREFLKGWIDGPVQPESAPRTVTEPKALAQQIILQGERRRGRLHEIPPADTLAGKIVRAAAKARGEVINE
jgi:hypothetical protein